MGKRFLLLPFVNAAIIAAFFMLSYSKGWDLEHTRLVDLNLLNGDGAIFLAFIGAMFLALGFNWILLKSQFSRKDLENTARFLRAVRQN